jgi:hypothetical protein
MHVGHNARQAPGSPLAPYQQAMLATMQAASGSPAASSNAGMYTPQHGNTMLTPVRTAPHGQQQQQQQHMMQMMQHHYGGMATTPSGSVMRQSPGHHHYQQQHQPPVWTSPKAVSMASVSPQRGMSQSRAPKESAPVPHARCRLADDLRSASHDELVQLLVELSSYSSDAANFIECKAQSLRLQAIADGDRAHFGSVATHLAMEGDATPEKGPNTAHATPMRGVAVEMETPPAPPFDKIERGQHQPPEHRDFLETRHPCITQYGKCRNPQSCVFARAPCNLCTAWIRGSCPDGARCTYVHRLPSDAVPQLKHLYDVKLARCGHSVQAATPAAATAVPVNGTPRTSRKL